jgi:hypothetical protein
VIMHLCPVQMTCEAGRQGKIVMHDFIIHCGLDITSRDQCFNEF